MACKFCRKEGRESIVVDDSWKLDLVQEPESNVVYLQIMNQPAEGEMQGLRIAINACPFCADSKMEV